MECARLGGQGGIIPLTIGNQKGRRWAFDMEQRGSLAPDLFVFAEHRGLTVTVGQIKNAAERNRSTDIPGRKMVGLQIAFIQSEQRREVPARGVPAHVDAVGVAAILTD